MTTARLAPARPESVEPACVAATRSQPSVAQRVAAPARCWIGAVCGLCLLALLACGGDASDDAAGRDAKDSPAAVETEGRDDEGYDGDEEFDEDEASLDDEEASEEQPSGDEEVDPEASEGEPEAPFDLSEDIAAVLIEGRELQARLEGVLASASCAQAAKIQAQLMELTALLTQLEDLGERWADASEAERDAMFGEVENRLDTLAETMINAEDLLGPCEA